MKNFDKVFPLLIKDEGGYSNDPSDSGGETNFGITQRETSIPVKTMTINQAKAIYKKNYWDALDCDNLPAGVDYTVFDYGVNSGLKRPRKALETFKDLSGAELINAINNERTAFLKRLAAQRPKDQKFLRGWLLRVERVRQASLALIKSSDHVSGPSTAVITGAGTGAIVASQYQHFWQSHPYLTISAILGVAVLVGYIVHLVRNKEKQNAVV